MNKIKIILLLALLLVIVIKPQHNKVIAENGNIELNTEDVNDQISQTKNSNNNTQLFSTKQLTKAKQIATQNKVNEQKFKENIFTKKQSVNEEKELKDKLFNQKVTTNENTKQPENNFETIVISFVSVICFVVMLFTYKFQQKRSSENEN